MSLNVISNSHAIPNILYQNTWTTCDFSTCQCTQKINKDSTFWIRKIITVYLRVQICFLSLIILGEQKIVCCFSELYSYKITNVLKAGKACSAIKHKGAKRRFIVMNYEHTCIHARMSIFQWDKPTLETLPVEKPELLQLEPDQHKWKLVVSGEGQNLINQKQRKTGEPILKRF